jgi:hypothetical protein
MSKYKGNNLDLRLRLLRNSKYNQIEMLSCQEDYFHQQAYEAVEIENIDLDAADEFLKEQDNLTSYAASSFLVAETRGLLRVRELLPKADAARLGGRLAILSEMQHEQAQDIRKIEFMPQSVVAGALRQYLAQRPEKEMAKLLEERADNITVNTRIYSSSGLATIAESNLKRKVEKQSWIVRKLLSKTPQEPARNLQTEVVEEEIAA